MPEFKVADMVHDYRALETARQDAANLVSSEAFWKDDEYRIVARSITFKRRPGREKLS